MKLRTLTVAFVASSALALTACPGDDLTYAEAKDAVVEATLASDAASLAEGSVEIATSFTLGGAVEQAASEIRDFITSQMPCAEVTLAGATLTVEYGKNPGNCQYRGRTYSGTHTITISRKESEVVVDHTWLDLSNGRVEVDGSAHVTWDLEAKSRRVEHELTWTRLSDGQSATGSGDRTQSPLGGSWENGISVDGSRSWEGPRGTWDLDIDTVEWRWIDPIPQSGTYTLPPPPDKTLSMTFSRVDDDTIEVFVEGARRDFSFKVTKIGKVTGEDPDA